MLDLGNYSLCAAVLLAGIAFVLALAAARFDSSDLLWFCRWAIGGFAGLLSLAAAVLVVAFLRSDFHLDYVVRYSERALPAGYKLAAFWAGQEGSLLLWGWLVAAMAVVLVITRRRETGRFEAVTLATIAVVLAFFPTLMLFAANPFAAGASVPGDGQGLNPMLQDPAMIAHPPFLFLGYAGFTFPFALMIAALVTGKLDNAWIGQIRRWTLAAWLFLTVGIVLGAWWAYIELGWGGYWAWDPVENASLLPWLTATALLHSLMVQQVRGMAKVWNVALVAVTFILCIFGSYLTRSGVIQSVHAFPRSGVGQFFMVFLLLAGAVSVGLIAWRTATGKLAPEHALEEVLGKEGAFLTTNVLLVLIMVTVLVGTIFPLLSGTIAEQQVAVGQGYYNKAVLPLALVLVALMAVGPLLSYGQGAAARLLRRLAIPGGIAVLAAGAALVAGVHSAWALVVIAIAVATLLIIGIELGTAVAGRAKEQGENLLVALVRLLDGNHRRYGGQIVHLGMILIVAGVAGSSLFDAKEALQFTPGQTRQFHGYTIQFGGLQDVTGANYVAADATLTVTDRAGRTTVLHPQRRQYNKAREFSSQIALISTWREDFYATLAGWEDGGKVTAIETMVKPLVSWIWIGGVLMTLGAVVALLPRVLPQRTGALAAAPEPTPAPGGVVTAQVLE